MIWILLAVGLVAVVEGLVLALAPSRVEQVMAKLASLSMDQRRFSGLAAVAVGVALIGLWRLGMA
jgi:uncharacterized protein